MDKFTDGQREFLLGEFIGSAVRVARSSHREYLSIEGRVVDETARTFEVHTGKGIRRVPKNCCHFAFPDANLVVDGRLLIGKPEDRTKRLYGKL
ncbi:ribonuclease P protein subunit [Candidatus Micrarchaeota archaeon]|nr:ribonuclease P protein subunit [Candidatus Micrarchaeota archaeon]MBI5177370.1 ribonuclease P protein subunit [Candidatus Micrarchaeota archaeon]